MSATLATIKSLIATTKESSRTLSELIRAASKASAQSTSTLVGVVGGLFGMAVAYGLTFVAPISLPVVGPICSGLGIVIGILLNRGTSRIEFEKKLEQNRIAEAEIMGRINALPRNAPQDVRDELWSTYKMLNSVTAIMGRTGATVVISGSPAQANQAISISRGAPDA